MELENSAPQLMDNSSADQVLEKLENESSLNMTINGGDGIISFPI